MERESEKEKERVRISQQSRSAGIPETGMDRKQITCSKCSKHTHQPEASQILVEYKKCNASSWNPQAAALTALLAVSVAQNSECVGLGIPRWHCVQGAAGTGVCCSKHSRERDCQLSRACRQATTHHSHEETQQVTRCHTQLARSQGLTRGRVRYGGFLYATAASRRPRAESKPPATLFLQGTPGCAL